MVEEHSEEDSTFAYSKTNSFKDIVLLHLKKIAELSCCEFRGGYFTEIVDDDGKRKEIYIEDSREKYNNAVITMAHLIYDKFNDPAKTAYKEYLDKMAKIREDFIEASSIKEKEILSEGFYSDPKDKILLEEYKIKKLALHRELFLKLSILLSKKNYFEVGGTTY